MFRRLKGKRYVVVVSAVVAVAIAGAAIAYFTATGSGTGQATVGSSTPWEVTFGATTGTMYPGSGTSTVNYTVKNAGSGSQHLAGTTASVAHDGSGNVTSHGTSVSGCLASWFSVTNHSPAATTLASGGTVTGSADVTMKNEEESQDACQGKTPDITVSAS
jgi:hypothetical protein